MMKLKSLIAGLILATMSAAPVLAQSAGAQLGAGQFFANPTGSPGRAQPVTPSASFAFSGTNFNLQPSAASVLGGVKSLTCSSHNWFNTLSTAGALGCTQPAFSDLTSSLACSQTPALTGDVTTSAGSCATSIAAAAVTNPKLASGGANTLKASLNGSSETDISAPTCNGPGQAWQWTAGVGITCGNIVSGYRIVAQANDTRFIRTVPVAVTITNASPAVVTLSNHGFLNGQTIVFSTNLGGTLPTGITGGQVYFVISAGLATNTFEFSATLNGAAVNTSSAGSGTFVLQAGNDATGSGSAQTATQAFMTAQGWVNWLQQNLDIGNFNALGQLGCAGGGGVATYGEPLVVAGAFVGGKQTNTAPQVVLSGDTTTPANCLWAPLSLPPNSAIVAVEGSGTKFGIQGVDLLPSISTEEGLLADSTAELWITGNTTFGAGNTGANGAHMEARTLGSIICASNYTVAAGSTYHWFMQTRGYVECSNVTVTFSGTPNFNGQVAKVDSGGFLQACNNTYSGSATGTRYLAQVAGTINTCGLAVGSFPGNAAGTPAAADTASASLGLYH